MRCWHAKTDGWAASTFHSNCDGKGPTVTIIKVGSYIFGGYTDLTWGGKYVFFFTAIFFSQFIALYLNSKRWVTRQSVSRILSSSSQMLMKNHKNKRMPVSVNDDSTNQIYVFKIVGKCLLNNLKKHLLVL